MSRFHRIFVYGSLKRKQPNHHLLSNLDGGGIQFIGRGKTVHQYPLIVAGRYNIPYILSLKGTGKNILGEVYEVDDNVLASLDKLERYPDHYQRLHIDVSLLTDEGQNSGSKQQNTIHVCWCYILENYKNHLLEHAFLEYFDNAEYPYLAPNDPRRVPLSEYDPIDEVLHR